MPYDDRCLPEDVKGEGGEGGAGGAGGGGGGANGRPGVASGSQIGGVLETESWKSGARIGPAAGSRLRLGATRPAFS